MKSHKAFFIQALMANLPDDFEGDLVDALDYVARYWRKRRDEGTVKEPVQLDKVVTLDDVASRLWNNPTSLCVMTAGFEKYNPDTGTWDIIYDSLGKAPEAKQEVLTWICGHCNNSGIGLAPLKCPQCGAPIEEY